MVFIFQLECQLVTSKTHTQCTMWNKFTVPRSTRNANSRVVGSCFDRFASHCSNREVKRTHPMIEKDSPEDARQPRRRLSIHGLEVSETATAMGPRLGQGVDAEWRRRRAFYSRINAERE